MQGSGAHPCGLARRPTISNNVNYSFCGFDSYYMMLFLYRHDRNAPAILTFKPRWLPKIRVPFIIINDVLVLVEVDKSHIKSMTTTSYVFYAQCFFCLIYSGRWRFWDRRVSQQNMPNAEYRWISAKRPVVQQCIHISEQLLAKVRYTRETKILLKC